MSDKIRVFIALELSEKNQQELHELQLLFSKLDLHIKWVQAGNLHLTLKFLGDIDPSLIEPLGNVVASCTKSLSPKNFDMCGLGTFPSLRKPKVFFAALKDSHNVISGLVNNLEERLEPLGLAKETRIFRPHITLGRFKSLKNVDTFRKKMDESALPEMEPVSLNQITIFKSTLSPTGPIYEAIKQISIDGEIHL